MHQHRTPAWLWALPVLTCGIASAGPPLAIALKARTTRAWTWCGAFATATLLAFVLLGSQPDDSDNVYTALGSTLLIACLVASPIYSVIAGREVPWGPPPPQPTPWGAPVDPNAAAVAQAQAQRQRRDEARELARRDPRLAHELRIGRPDLARQYDDGGLVDVNAVPAAVLTRWLGLTDEQAHQVVDARERLGRFEHPDDLVNLAGVDHGAYDRCSDRVIAL